MGFQLGRKSQELGYLELWQFKFPYAVAADQFSVQDGALWPFSFFNPVAKHIESLGAKLRRRFGNRGQTRMVLS